MCHAAEVLGTYTIVDEEVAEHGVRVRARASEVECALVRTARIVGGIHLLVDGLEGVDKDGVVGLGLWCE
jgi:hypothetical protein